jgi:hypothetical protein
MMMAKVQVYRKDTGEKVWVPEHYLDHPTLGKPFRKTPTQKSRDSEAEQRAAAEQAALAALQKTPTERAGSAANPPSTDEPASPGDKK